MSIGHGWVSHLCKSECSTTWIIRCPHWNGLVGSIANIDCYNKTFECLDEELNLKVVKGIPKVICVRHISTMQLKKLCGKSYRVHAAHVLEATDNETP